MGNAEEARIRLRQRSSDRFIHLMLYPKTCGKPLISSPIFFNSVNGLPDIQKVNERKRDFIDFSFLNEKYIFNSV